MNLYNQNNLVFLYKHFIKKVNKNKIQTMSDNNIFVKLIIHQIRNLFLKWNI